MATKESVGEGLYRVITNVFGWITDQREDEPNEEADAAGSDASPAACEFQPSDREGQADDAEWVAHCEIDETFQPEPIVMVRSPEDGMPVPAQERSDLAIAAPFTIDNVVCLEDERSYVELFVDELTERGWKVFTKDQPQRDERILGKLINSSGGEVMALMPARYNAAGQQRARRLFKPEQVQWRFERPFGQIGGKFESGVTIVPVRPARERCKFYKRQCMACSDIPEPTDFGHYMLFRNCTARRSVGGAFMSLRDEAVYACDYRDPPDPQSVEKHLDSRDRKRLASTEHTELIRPFNLADGPAG